jgi:hypothetical protein
MIFIYYLCIIKKRKTMENVIKFVTENWMLAGWVLFAILSVIFVILLVVHKKRVNFLWGDLNDAGEDIDRMCEENKKYQEELSKLRAELTLTGGKLKLAECRRDSAEEQLVDYKKQKFAVNTATKFLGYSTKAPSLKDVTAMIKVIYEQIK